MSFKISHRIIAFVFVGVLMAYVILIAAGLWMLTRSGAYSVALQEVGKRLDMQNGTLQRAMRIRWWKPWSYSESAVEGLASFTLCGQPKEGAEICFELVERKIDGNWRIVSIK